MGVKVCVCACLASGLLSRVQHVFASVTDQISRLMQPVEAKDGARCLEVVVGQLPLV